MPSLPIYSTPPRIQYLASASQTVFTVPFQFFAPQDLTVFYRPVNTTPNDFDDALILNTDYTVTSAVNYTGTITLSVACSANDVVTIVRSMANQRLNYYIEGANFTANGFNTDFESEVLMIQQNTMYATQVAPHYNLSATPLQANSDGGQDEILPVLGANQVWMKDPTDNFIQAVDFPTSGMSGGSAITNLITQNAHGFSVGQVVYLNGTTYTLANAATIGTAEVVGMVTSVPSANTFYLLIGGYCETLSGLTPGTVYFLSNVTPGALTATEPTTVGHISKPLVIADTSTSGYFFNFRGKINPSPAPTPIVMQWATLTSSATLQPNFGYYLNSGSTLNLALPTTFSVGDLIILVSLNNTRWNVTQSAGQTVIGNQLQTTVGASGSIASLINGVNCFSISLYGQTANTTFVAVSVNGQADFL